jgi:hypothetical protein
VIQILEIQMLVIQIQTQPDTCQYGCDARHRYHRHRCTDTHTDTHVIQIHIQMATTAVTIQTQIQIQYRYRQILQTDRQIHARCNNTDTIRCDTDVQDVTDRYRCW